jgi:hypothetical protein
MGGPGMVGLAILVNQVNTTVYLLVKEIYANFSLLFLDKSGCLSQSCTHLVSYIFK